MSLVTSVLKSSQELMPTLNKAYCIVSTVLFFFLDFLGVICRLSNEHKYKDRSKLGNFALGNEGTRVACKSLRSTSRFTRLTRDPCPLISQCKQKSVHLYYNLYITVHNEVISTIRILFQIHTLSYLS